MTRDQFRQLQRLQRLQDHSGRVWTVYAKPFQQEGVAQMIVRAGDLVRRVPEGFADDYMLLEVGEGTTRD